MDCADDRPWKSNIDWISISKRDVTPYRQITKCATDMLPSSSKSSYQTNGITFKKKEIFIKTALRISNISRIGTVAQKFVTSNSTILVEINILRGTK